MALKDVYLKAERESKRRKKTVRDSIHKANINNLGDWEIGHYVDDLDVSY